MTSIKEIERALKKRERKKQTSAKIRRVLQIAAVPMICLLLLCLFGYIVSKDLTQEETAVSAVSQPDISGLEIPAYSGQPYVEINNNVPFFDEADKETDTFESYSDLDALGRCGVAFANVSRELMPTETRGEIGSVKPSGWKQAKYEGLIDSDPPFLYNRCHLIAYCLTAENANEKNLITGTRYLNADGMLPFEEQVAKYLDKNDHHVLYRVTPVFEGDNLVASGVLMEAYSIEDNGAGISFCVYCYNVQPGVKIDYRTGESELE
jgi:DNA-entry nuclease